MNNSESESTPASGLAISGPLGDVGSRDPRFLAPDPTFSSARTKISRGSGTGQRTEGPCLGDPKALASPCQRDKRKRNQFIAEAEVSHATRAPLVIRYCSTLQTALSNGPRTENAPHCPTCSPCQQYKLDIRQTERERESEPSL